MKKIFKRLIIFYCVASVLSASSVAYASGAAYGLPLPGNLVDMSVSSAPALLKGIKVDRNDPFLLEFLFDSPKAVSSEEFSRMVEYFLACLTMPEENLYVNLSPYEPQTVCADSLAITDLGRDMLEQDYLLKQLSASLTYPETETGKKYWETINAVGAGSSPTNDFNKVWITPDKALVYENEGTAVIKEARLKVLADEDYLAMQNNGVGANNHSPVNQDAINRVSTSNNSADAFRKNILPLLEQDVNHGKNFSTLRQVYSAFILAVWFKKKLKDSVYKYYINQKKVSGIDKVDKQSRQDIYNLYVEAFKKGAYDYVKKDIVGANNYSPVKKIIRRRYFSGGVALTGQGVQFDPVTQRRIDDLVAGASGKGTVRIVDGRTGSPFLKNTVNAVVLAAGGLLAGHALGAENEAERVEQNQPRVELSDTSSVLISGKTTASTAATAKDSKSGASLDVAADVYSGGRVDTRGVLPLGPNYRLVPAGGYLGGDSRSDGYGSLNITPNPGASGPYLGVYYGGGSLSNEATTRLVLHGGFTSPQFSAEAFVNRSSDTYHWSDHPDTSFSFTTIGGILGSPSLDSQLYVASLGNSHLQAMATVYKGAVTGYAESNPDPAANHPREGELVIRPLRFLDSSGELLFVYNYAAQGSNSDPAASPSIDYNTFVVAGQGPLWTLSDGPAEKGQKLVWWGSLSGRFGGVGKFGTGSDEIWGNTGIQNLIYGGGLAGFNHGNGNGNATLTTWRWAVSVSPTNFVRAAGLGQPYFGLSASTETRYDQYTNTDKAKVFGLRYNKSTLSVPLPYGLYVDGGSYVYRYYPGEKAGFPNGVTQVQAFGGARMSFTAWSLPMQASITVASGSAMLTFSTSSGGHYAYRGDVANASAPLSVTRGTQENFAKANSAMTSASVGGYKAPAVKYASGDPRSVIAPGQMQIFVQGAKTSPYSAEIRRYLFLWGINLDALDPQNLSAADQKALTTLLRDPDLNMNPSETLNLFERVAQLQRRAIADPDGFGAWVKKNFNGLNLNGLEQKDFLVLLARWNNNSRALIFFLEGIPIWRDWDKFPVNPKPEKEKIEAKPATAPVAPAQEVKPLVEPPVAPALEQSPAVPVPEPAPAYDPNYVGPLPDRGSNRLELTMPKPQIDLMPVPEVEDGDINGNIEKPADPAPLRRHKWPKWKKSREPLPKIIINGPQHGTPAQPASPAPLTPPPAGKKGGTMGRWSYDRVVVNAADGTVTLVNAVRIARKDGVEEPEFLIKGRNAPRNIVLRYRLMNDDERRRVVALKPKLGIDSHVKVYILKRGTSAIFHRMLGLADDAIFLREDILDQGDDEQLAEALDHENIERTAATHIQARGAQYQGNLTALTKSLIEQDKRYVAKHPEQFEKFGGIVFDEKVVTLEGKSTEPFYVSPEIAEGFKQASSVSFKILALYSRSNGTQIAYNVR